VIEATYESFRRFFRNDLQKDPYERTKEMTHINSRRKMRHSSWTLFLVPLALPLVLFCFPGAARQVDQTPAPTVEVQEVVQEAALSTNNVLGASSGSMEEGIIERPEAYFKE
jgi:hypothetical protein